MPNKYLRGNGRECTVCRGTGMKLITPRAPMGAKKRACNACEGTGRLALREADIALRQRQGLNT
jgi:DnaJ-class molecular chaperone